MVHSVSFQKVKRGRGRISHEDMTGLIAARTRGICRPVSHDERFLFVSISRGGWVWPCENI